MYIHRVILQDVKGFERLDLRFDREDQSGKRIYSGWNVLTGINASGKSTVLKAIAIALVGPDTARALQPSFSGWVKKGADSATIAVQIAAGEVDSFERGRPPAEPFYAEVKLEQKGREVAASAGTQFVGKKKSALNGPWSIGQGVWFAAAYGPFRRLYGTSTEAQKLMSSPGRTPRFATLFKEDATLGEAQDWLKELQFKSLEGKQNEKRILSEVLELLESDFLKKGLRVDHVDSEGLWLRDEQGITLSLADMSDGYRSAIALLVDIARHLSFSFPDHQLIFRENDYVYVPHKGVVLIDEIDAHLHPDWQREIGFWLKRHLPNIQFIVSSHSAFVCQAADDLGIYALSAPESTGGDVRLNASEWEKVIAGTADDVLLSPAFGLLHTRSPRAVSAREEWSSLKAKWARVSLTPAESERIKQLQLFVTDDELVDERSR